MITNAPLHAGKKVQLKKTRNKENKNIPHPPREPKKN